MRIIVIGQAAFGAGVLEGLLAKGEEVAAFTRVGARDIAPGLHSVEEVAPLGGGLGEKERRQGSVGVMRDSQISSPADANRLAKIARDELGAI